MFNFCYMGLSIDLQITLALFIDNILGDLKR